MVTSCSTTQYSPIRTPGPIVASGETRAVDAMPAEGSIPDTLGDAAVTVLHAVVLIEGRNRSERFVVEALFAEPFLQILFEIVQRLELVGGRRAAHPAGRAEKLLVSAVHQHSDFAANEDARAF